MHPELIARINQVREVDAAYFGAKAWRLGDLARLGLPVPEGFVISSAAFRSLSTAEATSISQHEAPVDTAVLRKLVSGHVTEGERYAVRSSSLFEDGEQNSFAGIFSSFLGVEHDAIAESVVQCWQSICSEHARAYASQVGVASGITSMGVIVQRMVRASASGTAYSRDPVAGQSDEILIEAVLGLGETLADGRVIPDRYRVQPIMYRIVDKRIGRQAFELLMAESGGTCRKSLLRTERMRQKLTDGNIVALAKYVLQIKQHYKCEVDVEWADDGENLHVIQARPMTVVERAKDC